MTDTTRQTSTGDEQEPSPSEDDSEISPAVTLKLLLFLVWWFSGIGVGTAFMEPTVVGDGISPELLVVIILANFCSMLLIIAFIPGPNDSFDDSLDSSEPTSPESSTPE